MMAIKSRIVDLRLSTLDFRPLTFDHRHVSAPHITPQAPFYFIAGLFAGVADFYFLKITDTFFHRKFAGFIFMTYFRM